MDKVFKKYTSPGHPGAFSGLSAFKRNNKNLKSLDIEKALLKSKTYTLHKPKRLNYKRSRIEVAGIDDQWQIDLVDVRALKGSNYGHTFILTCIDVFSKYAWAVPLKDKEAKTCKEAFEKILNTSGRKPNYLYLDGGKEFLGAFKKYCQTEKILIIPTKSKLKACIVERFNRTLKEKMWRMFTYHSELKQKFPKNYTNYLDKLLITYNNSFHRTIQTKPNLVTHIIEKQINSKLLQNYDSIITFKFKIGDYVRISEEKKLFSKGYTPNWSSDIYIISNLVPSNPPKYILKDMTSKEYSYKFYKEELQKVLLEEFPYDTYTIHKESNNKILVEKLNSDKEQTWINKETFLEE